MKSKRFVIPLLIFFSLFLYGAFAIYGNISGTSPGTDTSQASHLISPVEAWNLIQKNKNNPGFVILDVRTPKEFFGGRISGAKNIDFYAPTFKDELIKLDKSKTYLVYCRSGVRSKAAVTLMISLGFKHLYDLEGGFLNWKKSHLPITKGGQ